MTTIDAPICFFCKHITHKTYPMTCKAFPDGIPAEALRPVGPGHRLPINGDHGIQFEQDPEKSPAPAINTTVGGAGFDRPEVRLLSELLDNLSDNLEDN